MQLFPYQETGVDFLAGRRRALLFDAPGLGKTPQALRAAAKIGANETSVVCPASVTRQWQRAKVKADVEINLASWSYNKAKEVPALACDADVLVLDEVHYLKNRSSQRSNALFGNEVYGRDGGIFKADRVWCLSGTPSPKNPGDLFPMMQAVVPGSLLTKSGTRLMDYWSFMRQFCNMYDSGHGMVVRNGKNLEELADRLAPYMLRRTKREVIKDYKEPLICELVLDADDAIDGLRRMENSPTGEMIRQVIERDGIEALEDLADDQLATLRRFTGMTKVQPVAEWLMDELGCGEQKVVVIAYHREAIETLSNVLTHAGIGNVVYYGGLTDNAKDEVMRCFTKKDTRVFIGQIISCGTGLDGLQEHASDIIFMEYSWIGDENRQAIDRLDRVGQTEPVTARFVSLAGSLDEAVTRRACQRVADNETLFG